MSQVDRYLDAAERANTRRSYESALRHFEVEWGGFLPATTDAVARYLAHYAATLTINTLRHRLAALSRWHADHGFLDPTKAPMIRQTLKGIRAIHTALEKRARPLELDMLQQISAWLDRGIGHAQAQGDTVAELRHSRDRALLLLGFWRGFRADELANLQVEYIEVKPGEGLTCYLPSTKGDRALAGRSFHCPVLSRLCPVEAYSVWLAVSGLRQGAVFRKIDRQGRLAAEGFHPGSLIPLLQKLFAAAGVAASTEYSSHSLRRGFAGWARASGWDLKDLMEYVGWKDVKSAMRYMDVLDSGLKARFEKGLPPIAQAPSKEPASGYASVLPASDATPSATIEATLSLTRFSTASRGLSRAHRTIEQLCFERYAMHRLDAAGTRYELTIPCPSREILDDIIYSLIDDMYRIAGDHQCALETTLHEAATNTYWD